MKKFVISLFSGLLMGLATAPISAFYLAWFAFILLWIFVNSDEKLHQNNFKNKLLMAFAWGLGYYGFALFWITGIHPMTWMGVPWLLSLLIAIFCWIFITIWGTLIPVCWSIGMNLYQSYQPQKLYLKSPLVTALLRVIFGVALWCSLEFIWSYSPLWWSCLAYTQSPNNLVILQLGKLSGFSIITASILTVNALIAEGIIYFFARPKLNFKVLILPTLAILLFSLLYLTGLFLKNLPLNDSNTIKVGIIQGNIPNEIKLYPAGWRKAIEGYTKGYQQLSQDKIDLVITPETALPFYWSEIVSSSSFYQAISTQKIPVLLGAFGQQGQSYTNSLFAVTGEGKVMSRYDKVKLVPLGEYIPFESFLGRIIERLSPLDAHLAAGNSYQIINTPVGQAIVGICYESAYGEHFRRQASDGGQFIIIASNDAHYSSAMPAQHHAQDVMRAIETDRWLAKATNTGYSAIVNPHGQTLWLSSLNTYTVHQDTIYRRQTQTLYVRWGDWLTKTLLVLGVGILIIKVINFR